MNRARLPRFALRAALCGLLTAIQLQAAEQPGDSLAAIQEKIVSFRLDNGLKVILYPRGYAPVISCATYVRTGSTDEHVGITGIAHQLEHLAFKGTALIGTRDYEAERKLLSEIDALYDRILAFQAEIPGSARDDLLALIARLSGGALGASLEPAGKALAELRTGWRKEGLDLPEARAGELARMLDEWASRVQKAENFVVNNQYAQVIERAGGSDLNAFTANDCTVYHVSLPANKLELWAALESDRFMNTFPRQMEKEKQVVLEERRMSTESSAFGKLHEALLGAAFRAHPYGVEVIGHRSDILNYTREKILRFYREHYTPGNTIVAVVGSLEPGKARELLTRYFGRVPPGPPVPQPSTVEPPQEGERRVEVEFPAQPRLLVGYHIPERRHPDTPALLALNHVASSGRASRLYTRLVKTGVAHAVSTWFDPGDRYPRLLVASAEPADATTLESLEASLLDQLERFKSEPPTAAELKRVATAWRAGVFEKLRTNLGMAIELADYEALSGDWRELFREMDAVAAVGPEQVAAVANRYLTKSNRTVARLVATEAAEPETILGVPPVPPK